MPKDELELTLSCLRTELISYKDEPFECLFEYLWNSFDAEATEVKINYTLPSSGIGYIDTISIEDNGAGWDFGKQRNTKTFLTSTKKSETDKKQKKSLPRGRYVFIWIADHLEIFSAKQKLGLHKDTKVKPEQTDNAPVVVTKLIICKPYEKFSNIFYDKQSLSQKIVIEFCWLLKQNDRYKIFINDEEVAIGFNISSELPFNKDIFTEDEDIKIINDFSLNGRIVIWKDKPPEWSSFFFLDEKNNEISVKPTGINKQKDNFFHSVYITSDFFKNSLLEDNDTEDSQLTLNANSKKKLKSKLMKLLKQKLIDIRKPYLVKNSHEILRG